MELKRGEIKAYRLHLNAVHGNLAERKGERGRYGSTGKRGYGDYLYQQDRVMFLVSLEAAKRRGEFTF